MSHSKRNTTRPVFTSYERALAKSNWASSSARLNRESFLPFGSCGLCLEIARDPICCQRGDIFCRECALANLVAQKQELKRADKARQNAEQEEARLRALEHEEEHARAVRDFELTQAGLSKMTTTTASTTNKATKRAAEDDAAQETDDGAATARTGTKRKFALDEDEMKRLADEDRARARKAIESEKKGCAKSSKALLPSFWTPSLTPSAQDSKLPPVAKQVKTKPMCPASMANDPHFLSLHKVITINFEEEKGANDGSKRICPSCRKVLSNALSPVMADKCGHVLCLSCVKQFLLLPAKANKDAAEDAGQPIHCFVCEAPAAVRSSKNPHAKDALPTGLVKLKSEGTGFSARGSSTVEKSGTVFQC
ncbi:Nitric oxide synthase-interacting protein -like protein [Escovopsis weberi]|uniref:Nitric oxide synthase-interacting protein-like protein n=1 Tax=Escovopsis weberi TaxID=150374 RepID=A0A0M8MTY1_ESCWE|nr:Nitric oxide synthase-interacting protein -like protein [Escovopsis weberi]